MRMTYRGLKPFGTTHLRGTEIISKFKTHVRISYNFSVYSKITIVLILCAGRLAGFVGFLSFLIGIVCVCLGTETEWAHRK